MAEIVKRTCQLVFLKMWQFLMTYDHKINSYHEVLGQFRNCTRDVLEKVKFIFQTTELKNSKRN